MDISTVSYSLPITLKLKNKNAMESAKYQHMNIFSHENMLNVRQIVYSHKYEQHKQASSSTMTLHWMIVLLEGFPNIKSQT